MNIRKLISTVLTLVILLLPAVINSKENKVPLLNELEQYTYINLKPHYTVQYMWGDTLSRLGVSNAIDAWNKAAGEKFMEMLPPDSLEAADIYAVPLDISGGGLAGIAIPPNNEVCMIHVSPAYQYNVPVWIHEIGHCIGFAHNSKPGSIMHPYDLKVKAVDKPTSKYLQKLLKRFK